MLKCWSASASQVVEQLSKPSPRNSTCTILGLTVSINKQQINGKCLLDFVDCSMINELGD